MNSQLNGDLKKRQESIENVFALVDGTGFLIVGIA